MNPGPDPAMLAELDQLLAGANTVLDDLVASWHDIDALCGETDTFTALVRQLTTRSSRELAGLAAVAIRRLAVSAEPP